MAARSEGSTYVREEVVENFILVKMTIAETLQLDVSDLQKSWRLHVLFEVFELGFRSEKLSASDVQFGDLSGIEKKCH